MRLSVAALGLLLLLPLLPAVPAADPGPFSIELAAPPWVPSGTVLQATGRILARDAVPAPLETVALKEDGRPLGTTTTGVLGEFTFPIVAGPRGKHLLRAIADPVEGNFHVESKLASYRSVVPASPPTALDVQPVPYSLLTHVTWGPPADDGDAPVVEYKVYRFDGVATTLVALKRMPGPLAFQENVPPSSTWTYSVTGTNMAGEGAAATFVYDSPPVPPADTFTAASPEFRRCWETTACAHPWSDHIRTTTQPFRFWIPIVGLVADAGRPIVGMPVVGYVTVTYPEGATESRQATGYTRADGTYEALVGPFEWGPGNGPQNVAYYFPISTYARYGTTNLDSGYHGLEVWVGDPYPCEYGCGGGGGY